MTWIEALILGVVQGLTEFLPVSSTAHIVLASKLLGLDFPGLAMEIFLHLASALALILYFRKELAGLTLDFFGFLRRPTEERRLGFYFSVYILVGTMITGILGLSLKEVFEDHLKSSFTLGIAFLCTAFFLFFVERIKRVGSRGRQEMSWRDAVIVGLIQSVAIFPGVSRSGAALVGSLLVGLNKETAVSFSFLLALPVILGSSVVALKDWDQSVMAQLSWSALSISFALSFFASLVGIKWLIAFVQKSRLVYFALYCAILGVLCLVFGLDLDV